MQTPFIGQGPNSQIRPLSISLDVSANYTAQKVRWKRGPTSVGLMSMVAGDISRAFYMFAASMHLEINDVST